MATKTKNKVKDGNFLQRLVLIICAAVMALFSIVPAGIYNLCVILDGFSNDAYYPSFFSSFVFWAFIISAALIVLYALSLGKEKSQGYCYAFIASGLTFSLYAICSSFDTIGSYLTNIIIGRYSFNFETILRYSFFAARNIIPVIVFAIAAFIIITKQKGVLKIILSVASLVLIVLYPLFDFLDFIDFFFVDNNIGYMFRNIDNYIFVLLAMLASYTTAIAYIALSLSATAVAFFSKPEAKKAPAVEELADSVPVVDVPKAEAPRTNVESEAEKAQRELEILQYKFQNDIISKEEYDEKAKALKAKL